MKPQELSLTETETSSPKTYQKYKKLRVLTTQVQLLASKSTKLDETKCCLQSDY